MNFSIAKVLSLIKLKSFFFFLLILFYWIHENYLPYHPFVTYSYTHALKPLGFSEVRTIAVIALVAERSRKSPLHYLTLRAIANNIKQKVKNILTGKDKSSRLKSKIYFLYGTRWVAVKFCFAFLPAKCCIPRPLQNNPLQQSPDCLTQSKSGISLSLLFLSWFLKLLSQ